MIPRRALLTIALFACTMAGSVAVFGGGGQAPTNVLNPASDLSGKTLVTAEGNRTISGVFTFSAAPLFPAGTVGLPGIAGSADSSTGLRLSAGSISASLAGTQRLLLDNSGLTVYGVNVVDNTGHVVPAVVTNTAAVLGATNAFSARNDFYTYTETKASPTISAWPAQLPCSSR